jgi:hypothetical protein
MAAKFYIPGGHEGDAELLPGIPAGPCGGGRSHLRLDGTVLMAGTSLPAGAHA